MQKTLWIEKLDKWLSFFILCYRYRLAMNRVMFASQVTMILTGWPIRMRDILFLSLYLEIVIWREWLCASYIYRTLNKIVASDCLRSVLIINYTKCTLQIHKHDTIVSFNNIDWHGVMSNLGFGDEVKIFVASNHGLVVKNTIVYLIYAESSDLENELASKKNSLIRFIKKIVIWLLVSH